MNKKCRPHKIGWAKITLPLEVCYYAHNTSGMLLAQEIPAATKLAHPNHLFILLLYIPRECRKLNSIAMAVTALEFKHRSSTSLASQSLELASEKCNRLEPPRKLSNAHQTHTSFLAAPGRWRAGGLLGNPQQQFCAHFSLYNRSYIRCAPCYHFSTWSQIITCSIFKAFFEVSAFRRMDLD